VRGLAVNKMVSVLVQVHYMMVVVQVSALALVLLTV